MSAETRKVYALRAGEVELIRRALRYYIHGEHVAIQGALAAVKISRNKGAANEHARDVTRQALTHIEAAQELLDRLMPASTLLGAMFAEKEVQTLIAAGFQHFDKEK